MIFCSRLTSVGNLLVIIRQLLVSLCFRTLRIFIEAPQERLLAPPLPTPSQSESYNIINMEYTGCTLTRYNTLPSPWVTATLLIRSVSHDAAASSPPAADPSLVPDQERFYWDLIRFIATTQFNPASELISEKKKQKFIQSLFISLNKYRI